MNFRIKESSTAVCAERLLSSCKLSKMEKRFNIMQFTYTYKELIIKTYLIEIHRHSIEKNIQNGLKSKIKLILIQSHKRHKKDH